MRDMIRESPLGQAIRLLSQAKLFRYPEEEPGFELPLQYVTLLNAKQGLNLQNQKSPSNREPSHVQASDLVSGTRSGGHESPDMEVLGKSTTTNSTYTVPFSNERLQAERTVAIERTQSRPIVPQTTADNLILVDWYTTDDPANPQNWSTFKKCSVVFILALYTFTVYCAGPVFTTSEPGLQVQFGVSPVATSLGLGLYVLAYGIGDLLFSPLTEIPIIGRNPVYWLTFIVFWALSFGPPTVNNFGGLVALRFWLGFFGSPALANGGATIGDMFALIYIPYGLLFWVFSAWGGPAIGPIIGGFAAMAKGWRWPMWEVVWMASPVLMCLLVFMPETSSQNILLRRASRLRKLTGDERLQSQSEIDQRHITASKVLTDALIRPMEIMFKDPSIFFVNLYTGYFYGVFYTFFEVFPLVFPPFYGFNLGQTGLAFVSCLIGVTVAIVAYSSYLYFYMVPDNIKNGLREQEHRLIPAIVGSFLLPIGLFTFAWTSDGNIHWSVPLVGVGIFTIGHYFTMQSLFIYIPFSYPQYAASLFAGNSIWRSGIAGGAVVFARPLFINLGVHRGVSLLGGLSCAGIFGTTAIYIFGKKLRARSKFAMH